MSNTRYHSIGLKVKEKQESNPGRQSDDRMGENSRGKANLKRWVLSFQHNVETDNELQVSGGRGNTTYFFLPNQVCWRRVNWQAL